MQPISYTRHRFPAEVIRQAVWLYFRFSLSLRDVEELMAARGVEVSYETHPLLDDQVRARNRSEPAAGAPPPLPALAPG